MTTPQSYSDEQREAFERDLFELLRIPSVSTDEAFAAEVRRCADWLVVQLHAIGLKAELIETERHPLVYAEWLEAGPDAKTVLIYGHYDVQPAVVEDGWESDPFEPEVKDGKVYARGATDDKGQMFAHIKAVEALLRTEGDLPVNVKFILEGEEESGGRSIAMFVDEQREKLAADVCVVSDTSMADMHQPSIVTSLRGMVAGEIVVTGPAQDLHSGMYGGTVHNPVQALAEIVARLHNADGSVAVPGFYDDVVVPDAEERATIRTWEEDRWRAETGAPQPWGEADFTLRERIGIRPTLEINGMAGGYYGSGFKTVLPAKAIAKVSCRLVAEQDPQRISEALQAYVAEITPPTVRSQVIIYGTSPALQVPVDSPVMRAAVRAFERGWGAAPNFEREGGGIPIVGDIQQKLGVPVVLMGFGLNTDGPHGPNEHFSLEMFHRGVATSIHFLQAMAALEATG